MLKKSLPKIKQKIQQIKSLLLPLEDQNHPQNPSPNLLIPIHTKNLILKIRPKIILSANFFVLLVGIFFTTLQLVNSLLDIKLAGLKKTKDDLILQIDLKADADLEAKQMGGLINIHKQIAKQNEKLLAAQTFITTEIEKKIDLNSLYFDKNKNTFEVGSNTKDLLAYGRMLSEIIDSDLFESIVLERVELVSRTGTYTANFSLKIK